jgi:large subunit ribosomal protein L24
MEMPVSLTSVRLVVPLRDPSTGVTRDVIVKKLVNEGFWHDRHLNKTSWKRKIPGLNIRIPWPVKDDAPKEKKDYPGDTLRLDVEVRSFIPTLLRPPMPSSVIDELRNKFSKFRTRHDPDYIAEKIKEEEEKNAKSKMIQEMWTPTNEVNRRERRLKKQKGKPRLSSKMLVRIGKVIAKKQQSIVNAADASKKRAVVLA